MTAYISAREALSRELESAKAALSGAQEVYDDAEYQLRVAQGASSRAYDARARNSRNVDRLEKAIAILDGRDE
ncbi:hypothetical protein IT072_13870 [Leifsonia sp. ZF2019]|uniref:hypothetical protein n=1 Tax=Leifsonia sp. ZF2019 TaxID=2781978 RepID=UPI001CC04958|nr:hypothetical protein [Leifsonia sp. ZF2019]UAJ78345.1 hypothetical protein IT072_13870 [Leifsonia sp. ZF2019]